MSSTVGYGFELKLDAEEEGFGDLEMDIVNKYPTLTVLSSCPEYSSEPVRTFLVVSSSTVRAGNGGTTTAATEFAFSEPDVQDLVEAVEEMNLEVVGAASWWLVDYFVY